MGVSPPMAFYTYCEIGGVAPNGILHSLKNRWWFHLSGNLSPSAGDLFQGVPRSSGHSSCGHVFPRSSKKFQGVPKSSNELQGVPGSSNEFQGVPGSTDEFLRAPRSSRGIQGNQVILLVAIHLQGFPRSSREFQKVPMGSKETRKYQWVPESSKEFQGVPRSFGHSSCGHLFPRSSKESQGVPKSSKEFQGVQMSSREFQGVPMRTCDFRGIARITRELWPFLLWPINYRNESEMIWTGQKLCEMVGHFWNDLELSEMMRICWNIWEGGNRNPTVIYLLSELVWKTRIIWTSLET